MLRFKCLWGCHVTVTRSVFVHHCIPSMGFPDGSAVKNLLVKQEAQVDPWVGRTSGEGNGNPLQCSFLENPMDGGA